MTVRCAIFLLLFPLVSLAQEQYYGTRLLSLSLSGGTASDLEKTSLHTNDVLTPENVRAAIQALYASGRYQSIEVDATSGGAGTRLEFKVRPHFYIATVRLEPDDFLDRSLSGFFRLPIGEKLSQNRVDRIVAQTEQLLRSEGYFDATVQAQVETDDKAHLATIVLKAGASRRARVGSVSFKGGENTYKSSDLQDAFGLNPDDLFSSEKVDAGIRNLQDLFANLEIGGFLNSRVEVAQKYEPATHKVDLTVTIDPGRFTLVEAVGFSIPAKRLKTLVPIYEEGTVDQDLVEEGRNRIRAYMQQQGYFEAGVTTETIEAPLDNAVQVNYTIDKRARHRIRSVRIRGNTHFPVEAFKGRLKIRSAGLTDLGVFSPEILNQDVQSILAVYRNAGFDGTTVEGDYEEGNHQLDVIITVREGRQLPIAAVTFAGNQKVETAELLERTGLLIRDTYTPTAVDDARNSLTTMYYYKGFPDVQVVPETSRDASGDNVNIAFRIAEGESYAIGRIIVSGNRLTQEKIIHRYSGLYSATPYNPEAILEAQQNLYATGLFTRVDIVPFEQSDRPGFRDVLIQVEDAKPILLAPGIGYQEQDGVRGTVDFTHSNLFGQDRTISFRVRGSWNIQDKALGYRFQTTYREPRLFNRDIAGFATMLIEKTHQEKYDANRWDFSIRGLKQVTPSLSLNLTASYQTVNPQDIRINPRAGEFKDEAGIIQIARLETQLLSDRRNDAIEPSRGTFASTTFQIASTRLGSEVNFTSLFNQARYYRPAGTGVLAGSLRFGWNHPYGGTTRLPITERYFAGGSTTLRGFDQDEAGPEGGGNALALGNFEYRVPTPIFHLKDLGAAAFYDVGNVFPNLSAFALREFTHSAGGGLRYKTPLGPIRFDVGFNLRPKLLLDGKREQRIQYFFTLGHTF